MNFGSLRFFNARASGVQLAQLSSGTYDHLAFGGPNGANSAVNVGNYQDTTFISDSDGNPLGPNFGSGFCTNCKNIGASTVRISGLPLGPYEALIVNVNKFHVQNLSTEPFFRNIPSGTLLIRYDASGTSKVHTYNAKLYAYDNTGSINDEPPDVTVVGFEINASGIWKNTAHSGVWKQMHTTSNALQFADHSDKNGYRTSNVHLWVAAISVRGDSVGVLDQFDFAWQHSFF